MASKITIKRSLTAAAPAGLSFGEMALVQGSGLTANQLYVGISGGNPVWVGAQIGTTGTWTDNSAQTSLATQYAIEQRIGAKIIASATGVSSFNGLTGAVGGVTTSVANTFTALQSFSAGISASGGTFTSDIKVNSLTVGRGSGGISSNVAVGQNALAANTTAQNSTAVGQNALQSNIDGGSNTAVGSSALEANTTGSQNVAVGLQALYQNTTGSSNFAGGYGALYYNTTGTNNIAVGEAALKNNTTGTNKTAIGYAAGQFRGTGTDTHITGTGGIYIGYQARGSANGQTNEIVIGVDALALGSNTAVIGATSQTAATIYGVLNLPSGLSTTGATFTGNISAPNIVSSFNGLTGAVGGVTTSVANTFTALQTFSTGISTSGGTFGTPTQLVGTNITGTASGLTAGRVTTNANLTGAITSVGNTTSLGSFTGQELYDALGIKTGTSKPVFDTSPTLITPTIGAALATSINKVTITAPATGSTITVADGKTLAVNNTLTFTGTDTASVAFGAGGTVVYTATNVASFNGLTGAVTGVSSFNGATGAVGGVTTSVANTFTALQTFSAGISTSGGTFGTPTQLVGTNITGTATGFTASNVTTNANLTGAITSVGNGTTLGSFTSAHLRNALTDETGTGVAVFGTEPAITTSLTTPSTSFNLLNTTATTVNFAGAATALNLGVIGGTATFAGSVIVNGDFTVQGNTTTLNTTTLNVEDFNITMGLTLTSAAQCTGAGIGIGVGTGITFAYDHGSLGWLSSVNMDLASGKVFKIANASVLSSSALGAGVTGSSLTQVGTITSGTWQGTAIAPAYVTTLNQNTTGSAATVTTAAQPAITSVGTLTSLTVSGTLEAGLIDAGTF